MEEDDIFYAIVQALEDELYYLLEEQGFDKNFVFDQAEKAVNHLRANYQSPSAEEDEREEEDE
tara:strand:+ start:2062 stop:2250 length:189 start_codon:yes stop_codon:yes gene_type:complete